MKFFRKLNSLHIQDPTLFSGTIKENILYGLSLATHANEQDKRTMDDVIEAAKRANAHDFISSLSQSYDTHIGKPTMTISHLFMKRYERNPRLFSQNPNW